MENKKLQELWGLVEHGRIISRRLHKTHMNRPLIYDSKESAVKGLSQFKRFYEKLEVKKLSIEIVGWSIYRKGLNMDFLKVFGKYNEYINYYKEDNFFEIIDPNDTERVAIYLNDLDNLIETLNILKEEIEKNENN